MFLFRQQYTHFTFSLTTFHWPQRRYPHLALSKPQTNTYLHGQPPRFLHTITDGIIGTCERNFRSTYFPWRCEPSATEISATRVLAHDSVDGWACLLYTTHESLISDMKPVAQSIMVISPTNSIGSHSYRMYAHRGFSQCCWRGIAPETLRIFTHIPTSGTVVYHVSRWLPMTSPIQWKWNSYNLLSPLSVWHLGLTWPCKTATAGQLVARSIRRWTDARRQCRSRSLGFTPFKANGPP